MTRPPHTLAATGSFAATPPAGTSIPQRRETRLGRTFSARAARLGTLEHLSKLAPVAIIAETLGYHPATIERHAAASSAGYAQYIAAITDTQTDLTIDSP